MSLDFKSSIDASATHLDLFYEAAANQYSHATLAVTDQGAVVHAGAAEDGSCYSRTITSEEQEANRRSWRALYAALLDGHCTEAKIARFCERYQINFQKAIDKGLPLQVRHIERIAVGVATILADDMRAAPKELTRAQITTRLSEKQTPFFNFAKEVSPLKIKGGTETAGGLLSVDLCEFDRQKLLLSRDLNKLAHQEMEAQFGLAEFAALERLAKVFVSKEMQPGEIIPTLNDLGEIDYYVVHKKIATDTGLMAYAMKPFASDSRLKPTLFFRPTQMLLAAESGIETLWDDFETKVGHLGYSKAKKLQEFETLLQDQLFLAEGEKMRLVGYSLGGTQAERFLRDHWRAVDEAIFFNNPSLEKETAEAFATEINAIEHAEEDPFLTIRIFRSRGKNVADGDIVDYGGEKHIGHGVTNPGVRIILKEGQNVPHGGRWLGPHAARLGEPDLRDQLNEAGFRLVTYSSDNPQELNMQLDNSQRGAEIAAYEPFRTSCIIRTLYYMLYAVFLCLKGIFYCFCIDILRTGQTEEVSYIQDDELVALT